MGVIAIHCWVGLGEYLCLEGQVSCAFFPNFFPAVLEAVSDTLLKDLVRCMSLRTLKLTSPCLKQIFLTREIYKEFPKWYKINSLCLVLTISVTAVRRKCHITKSFHSGFQLHLRYDLPPSWKFQRKEVTFLAIQLEEWLKALFSLCCDYRKDPFSLKLAGITELHFPLEVPAQPTGSPVLSKPHTVPLAISKVIFRGTG